MRMIAIPMAMLLAAAPAAAQQAAPRLSIAPGESVTVRIVDAGFVELARTRGEPDGPRAEDTIRFTFTDMGGMLMLHAENGYARAFRYRARMVGGGRSANTSMCTVLPRIATFETWADRIDRLELREPQLTDDTEMACR